MIRTLSIVIVDCSNNFHRGFNCNLKDGESALVEGTLDGKIWSPLTYPHSLVSCTTLVHHTDGKINDSGGYMADVHGLVDLRVRVVGQSFAKDCDEPILVEVRK